MAPDDIEPLDAEEEGIDQSLETEADVSCPHCGAGVSIEIDPGGGKSQTYVQDCEVCCRPWQVSVWYHAGGGADVELTALE